MSIIIYRWLAENLMGAPAAWMPALDHSSQPCRRRWLAEL
jgi:hypothetical protein